MNENEDVEIVVVAVRYKEKIRWYRSDRDLWVLDVNKWRNEVISYGYDVPEFNDKYRSGIFAVTQDKTDAFLDYMKDFEISKDQLSFELATRFSSAHSWWDVADLFPIMFVDFDSKKVAAFYLEGTPMERHIPDGWCGEFIDFSYEYSDNIFPIEDKFWIKGGVDLLKIIISRDIANQ